MQVRTMVARQTWRLAVYDAGYALTHAPAAETRGEPANGHRGALSVLAWVNRVLAAVDLSIPKAPGLLVVLEAARVLGDPGLCLAVRAAWALGGIEAAAGVVKREAYPIAQGDGYE